MMGMPINLAKATGLFINSASTITASAMNFFRSVLDVRFALPLIISIMVASLVGACLSQYAPKEIIEWMLVIFLVVSSLLLIFSNREAKVAYDKAWILYVIGGSVGLVSAAIGVGGGSLIMPLLILLGFDAKKSGLCHQFCHSFFDARSICYLLVICPHGLDITGRCDRCGNYRRLSWRQNHALSPYAQTGKEINCRYPAAACGQDVIETCHTSN